MAESRPTARILPSPGDLLVRLAALQDPVGVLSMYVDADPSRQSGTRPQWEVVLRDALSRLRARVKDDLPHAAWTTVHARLDTLVPEIARLADVHGEGRGRALFATVTGDAVESVALQVPLPDRVVLAERAHLGPLVDALDAVPPTGIVAVARDGLHMVDWRAGVAEDAGEIAYREDTSGWREKKGTAGRNPALGGAGGAVPGGGPATGAMYQQTGAAQRDRYDRAIEDHQVRFLSHRGEDVARIARERGWVRLVLSGDPRLVNPLAEALPPDGGWELLTLGTIAEWRSPAGVAETVTPELERWARERERRLVDEARDRAGAGGRGALGANDVLAALEEGRVDTLLVVPGTALSGGRAPDGRVVPEGVVPPGVAPADLQPVPDLVEAMVAAALSTSARVVHVRGEAADALAAQGGVGALLRW